MKQLTPEALTDTQVMPVKKLNEHPDNVRKGDVDAIVASLETHGQYRPLIVQKSTMFVCAGNHTLKAARRLGMETLAVTVLDIDDDQARRILAVDNRASDNATYDYAGLADLLASFADSNAGLAGTGYTEVDLNDLLADQAFREAIKPGDVSDLPALDVVGDSWSKDDKNIECPNCGHKFS